MSQRGVGLVATAHGEPLRQLLASGDLNALLGGKQSVILGDAAAKCAAAHLVMCLGHVPHACLC